MHDCKDPITPVTHSGNFPWWLIEAPIVLFFSTLIGIATAWFVIMVGIYGMSEMPRLFENIYEQQGAIMILLPIALTSLYYTISKIKKAWLHGSS